MFDGLTVAMVTPFRGGAVDHEGTARLIDFMLEGGVEGLVISGSTGEAATCTVEERRALWRFAKERVRGRVPLVAGTGTHSTAESITLTRMGADLGLDGAMIVTPYYNKPTPKGQIAHFTAVAKSTRLPLILYNVPGRTATNTLPETFEQVQDLPNVVAIKEASGNVDQTSALRARTRFTVLSGDDSLTLPLVAVGATGVISVAGQVAPREMRTLCDHARHGRMAEAESAHRRLLPIFKALFLESNPGPVKYLLSAMRLIENELRLPLVPVEPGTQRAILEAAAAGGEIHPVDPRLVADQQAEFAEEFVGAEALDLQVVACAGAVARRRGRDARDHALCLLQLAGGARANAGPQRGHGSVLGHRLHREDLTGGEGAPEPREGRGQDFPVATQGQDVLVPHRAVEREGVDQEERGHGA